MIAALAALVRVTLLRLIRGRTLWIAGVIAAMPIVFAVAARSQRRAVHYTFIIEMLVLTVLPPLFVAAPIGEDLENGTASYLWSRSLPRWSVLIGKLIALAPIAIAYLVASWLISIAIVIGKLPTAESTLGLGGSTLAVAVIVAAIAVLVPKQAMALSIAYVGIDFVIGQVPAPIQMISVTHLAGELCIADAPALIPALAITAIALAWLAAALVKIRRLEM